MKFRHGFNFCSKCFWTWFSLVSCTSLLTIPFRSFGRETFKSKTRSETLTRLYDSLMQICPNIIVVWFAYPRKQVDENICWFLLSFEAIIFLLMDNGRWSDNLMIWSSSFSKLVWLKSIFVLLPGSLTSSVYITYYLISWGNSFYKRPNSIYIFN